MRWRLPLTLVASLVIGLAPVRAMVGQVGPVVVVHAIDAAGVPVPGACFSVLFPSVAYPIKSACDADDGAEDGMTTIAEVYVATGELVVDRPPAGYLAGGSLAFNLVGATTEASFTLEAGGETLTVAMVDDTGRPQPGGCAMAFQAIGSVVRYVARACDGMDGGDGAVTLNGLAPDEYVVQDAGGLPPNTVVSTGTGSLTVESGGENRVTFTLGPAGSVAVSVVDEDGEPVPGICLTLAVDAAALDLGSGVFFCAGTEGEQLGVAISNAVPIGQYVLGPSSLPAGYLAPAEPVVVRVSEADVADVQLTLARGSQGIVVSLIGEGGEAVSGGCVQLAAGDRTLAFSLLMECDGTDLTAGQVTIWGIEPGTYTLSGSSVPAPYGAPQPVTVTVEEGAAAEATLVHGPGTTVVATAVDGEGQPFPAACFFTIVMDGFTPAYFGDVGCDADDGQEDGTTRLDGLPSGRGVAIVPYITVRGYTTPYAEIVTGDPGAERTVEFTFGQGGKGAAIERIGGDGEPLVGSCFLVYRVGNEPETIAGYRCDGFDGVNDGVTRMPGLRSGNYLAVEVIPAIGETDLAAPAPFAVERGVSPRVIVGSENQERASPVASPEASPAAPAA